MEKSQKNSSHYPFFFIRPIQNLSAVKCTKILVFGSNLGVINTPILTSSFFFRQIQRAQTSQRQKFCGYPQKAQILRFSGKISKKFKPLQFFYHFFPPRKSKKYCVQKRTQVEILGYLQ